MTPKLIMQASLNHGVHPTALLTFALLLIQSLASANPTSFKGSALVYRPDMHGKPLSTGEAFRHDRLTAGHATIPIGTVVRVTNPTNQKTIDVLINDQWKGNGSVIILSRAAASVIGVIKDDGTQVIMQPLTHPIASGTPVQKVALPIALPAPPQAQPAVKPPGLYFLEFASYRNIVQAKLFAMKLTNRGAPSKVVQDQRGLNHVISDGYFTSLNDASKAFHLVKKNVGYSATIKKL